MVNVSNEEIDRFDRAIRSAIKRLGGGKVGIEADALRDVVRPHKDAAYRYVEIYCKMAASQPGYLQMAMVVAGAYQVEFKDDTLATMVMARARQLGAMEHLKAIGFAPNEDELGKEPPEREAARQWWRSTSRSDGMCDLCRHPLRRGDGYLLDGRLTMIGKMKVNNGVEILCKSCFEEHREDLRDPGGRGDNYTRIG